LGWERFRLTGGFGEGCGWAGPALVANWILHLGHGFELQPQSAAGLYMPHHAIGSNLSLWDKKMNLGDRAYALLLGGLNEQPSHAQIRYAGHIAIFVTLPVDPHTLP